jgi:hypothetical protein
MRGWHISLCVLTTASTALALDGATIAGDPVNLEVTEAASVSYNSNNRDDAPADASTRANDDWGVWVNRIHAQGSWRKWRLALRLDSASFYRSPDPTQIGLDLVRKRPGGTTATDAPEFFRSKVNEAGVELSNRYINWLYPAKYTLGYTTPDVELTFGDYYAQLGRGFVLSVRKQDELANDTTVRGARVTGRASSGDVRIRVTGLWGTMNPLRIDEASGRYLGTDGVTLRGPAILTEAGMPRAIETDFVPRREDCARFGTCTYAVDQIVAGQLELGPRAFKLSTQASVLMRTDGDSSDEAFTSLSPDAIRAARDVVTASQSLDVPTIGQHGALYVEGAVQDPDGGPRELQPGYAIYATTSYVGKRGSVLLEGKHYRRFFPLAANTKLARAREFSLVQYSSVPTTNAFWVDTEFEGFNTCVTGGRLKGDWHATRSANLFVWIGRYHTWAESVTNERCVVAQENENRVWDGATGFEVDWQERRSRADVTIGARFDDTVRLIEAIGTCTDPTTEEESPCTRGITTVFYREGYVRYDAVQWIHGPFSAQLQGWHRRRHQALGGAEDPWYEGQHLTGFEWAGRLSLAFGVEYDTNPQTAPTYYNGQFVYLINEGTNVSLFVGQRRGTLRCVSGVCRVFPAFEGARLDFTGRF